MAKVILGFVGPIASGKGTACQYLRDQHRAPTYRFSSPLRDVLDRLYLPQSRQNMQDLSLALRHGYRVWEIPVHWEAVPGSKVNLVTDTVQMAWSVVLLYVRRWFR